MIDFIVRIPEDLPGSGLQELFVRRPPEVIHFDGEQQELMLWGDPIGGEKLAGRLRGGVGQGAVARVTVTPGVILSEVQGHYYFLLLDKKEKVLHAGNSIFSILPVYYTEVNGEVILSNNAPDLGRYLGLERVSRRFILETVLFNYPLFNESIIDRVCLLPANSLMKIGRGGFTVARHTAPEDNFSSDPVPWRRAAESVSDAFLETVKRYLPSGRYVNALTGGLDSRTLVAAGLASGGEPLCYSFGAPGSKDIEIPGRVAATAGLPYMKLLLDDDYVRNESLRYGLEFVRSASGSASFVRGHYLYAAARMSEHSRYMITGNFGSELFRAANVRGVVFSPNLIALFSSNSLDEALKTIRNSSEFNAVRRESFAAEWDQLRQDLTGLPCFNPDYRQMTRNQKFYLFVFEEVFRKYFGAEMAGQFKYIRNRTPFIDAGFLKILLGTGFAGVYSDFFERNPLRRYKGQLLYAHIIRKSRPDLGRIMSDKGYCPEDLLTVTGRLNVIGGYLKKKRSKAKSAADPYSVSRSFRHNLGFYRQIPVDFGLFNQGHLSDLAFAAADRRLYKILSLSLAKAEAEGWKHPDL